MNEWIEIPRFEFRYLINKNGDIVNKENSYAQLKGWIDEDGYKKVCLRKVGQKKEYWRVHRLVATLFIPNPENKPTVNHKDGNKLNNHIDNLEWATQQENIIHAFENNLMKKNGVTMKRRLPTIRKRQSKRVTQEIRSDVKRMRTDGFLLREIATKYDFSLSYLSTIINDCA